MRRLCVALILLAGCSTDPPSDPCGGVDGNEQGDVTFRPYDLSPLFVGETRTFDLVRRFTDGAKEYPFVAPATITDDSGSVAITRLGSSLVVTGVHDGSANINLVTNACPGLRGSTQIDVRMIDDVTLVPGTKAQYMPSQPADQIPPGVDVAFAREASHQVGIGLVTSRGEVLTELYKQLTLPAGAQEVAGWGFDDSGVAEGSYSVEVAAGSSSFTAPFVVVDHAETITAITQDLTVHSNGLSPCFAAMTAGRYVASLMWTYSLDGDPAPTGQYFHNCVSILPANDVDHDGMIEIAVSAGGVTVQFSAPVL